MAKGSKGKVRVLALSLVFMAGVAIYLASQMSFGPAYRILPGIYVLNINLSLMNHDQAMLSLKKMEQEFQRPLTVKYKDITWTLPMDRVGLRLNSQQEVQRAMDIGRTGSLWQRFLERRQAYQGIRLQPQIIIDSGLLEKQVAEATEVILLPPRDAVDYKS
ncbi:hypothetical protein P378_05330 [Desulforamulus profundi]|uniref:YoaR-like putative peptidoglycan binding domain-containing protein n=1 Tax=Desulforamulus profundi TaxID=1383067 RepID=A0A2C6LKL9_9FIRM|nr:peptidoglycan binding domain-containing protein [Desulforamulus profundi]PHJ39130.1 hypothetical protein P378_05330 [Desulforamulus profundi]